MDTKDPGPKVVGRSKGGSPILQYGKGESKRPLGFVDPVTAAECDLKLQRGSDAIYDLFDEHRHPFVFAGDRASYV